MTSLKLPTTNLLPSAVQPQTSISQGAPAISSLANGGLRTVPIISSTQAAFPASIGTGFIGDKMPQSFGVDFIQRSGSTYVRVGGVGKFNATMSLCARSVSNARMFAARPAGLGELSVARHKKSAEVSSSAARKPSDLRAEEVDEPEEKQKIGIEEQFERCAASLKKLCPSVKSLSGHDVLDSISKHLSRRSIYFEGPCFRNPKILAVSEFKMEESRGIFVAFDLDGLHRKRFDGDRYNFKLYLKDFAPWLHTTYAGPIGERVPDEFDDGTQVIFRCFEEIITSGKPPSAVRKGELEELDELMARAADPESADEADEDDVGNAQI